MGCVKEHTNRLLQQHIRAARYRDDDEVTAFEPVAYLVEGSRTYCARYGLFHPYIDFARVVVDPARATTIAAAYLQAPWFDERALVQYRAFRDETLRQFDFLTASPLRGGLGVVVEVTDVDPYADAVTMANDLRESRRLRVYSSEACNNPHPLLSHDENTMFRAVHDAFGHAASGRGFDVHGEEASWLKHLFMYTGPARLALTTETRGQSSAFIFGLHGRRFPEQKAVILPELFANPSNVTLLEK